MAVHARISRRINDAGYSCFCTEVLTGWMPGSPGCLPPEALRGNGRFRPRADIRLPAGRRPIPAGSGLPALGGTTARSRPSSIAMMDFLRSANNLGNAPFADQRLAATVRFNPRWWKVRRPNVRRPKNQPGRPRLRQRQKRSSSAFGRVSVRNWIHSLSVSWRPSATSDGTDPSADSARPEREGAATASCSTACDDART